MKIIAFILIAYVSSLLINDFNSYGLDAAKPNDRINQAQQSQKDAESTLKKFLNYRSDGRFSECAKFLTKKFNDKFSKTHRTDFVDYFRNQNEDYFRNPIIQDASWLDNATVVIKVVTEVEGPGYQTKAFETYYMILEKGEWKIDDWQIKYNMP